VPAAPPPVALVQLPDEQICPPLHIVHTAPPEPHFIALGVCTQVVPSQHPPQLAGPHVVAVTQAPLKQVWVAPHCWHTPASLPHARLEFPGAHTPPSSRQPGQVKATH
jgi:hypothetical protein